MYFFACHSALGSKYSTGICPSTDALTYPAHKHTHQHPTCTHSQPHARLLSNMHPSTCIMNCATAPALCPPHTSVACHRCGTAAPPAPLPLSSLPRPPGTSTPAGCSACIAAHPAVRAALLIRGADDPPATPSSVLLTPPSPCPHPFHRAHHALVRDTVPSWVILCPHLGRCALVHDADTFLAPPFARRPLPTSVLPPCACPFAHPPTT